MARAYHPPRVPALAVAVKDLEKSREELIERGIAFEGETVDLPAGRVAFFLDPDGYTVGLIERRD